MPIPVLDFRRCPAFFENNFRVEDRLQPQHYVPFKVNSAQLDFIKICAQTQEQNALTWIIAIKPRRVGLSRVVTGIGTMMAFATAGMDGIVMANLGSTLTKILESYRVMARGLPTRVQTGTKSDDPIRIGKGRRPSVLIGAKALATGEGRGGAAMFMQLTEAAHYPPTSPFTAMLPSVPRSPDTFIGIESTPNPDRRGVAFKDMWDNARWIHDKNRDSLFVRYFCPWMRDPYAVTKIIPRDIPKDDEERVLLRAGVSKVTIAWRRQEIRGRYRGKVELFEMENPTDPDSAFTKSAMPAFSQEERVWSAQTVENNFVNGDFYADGPNSPVKLIPTPPDARPGGWWRVYEEPQKNCEYYVGVDAARGIDWARPTAEPGDFAAIVIINGTTCAIAAVLEQWIPPDIVARQCYLAGKYYRTQEISEWHWAMMNIEISGGFGNEVQRRLIQDHNYPIHRFLRWRGRDDRIHNRPGQNIGWVSTGASNDMKLNTFRIALANHVLRVRDYRLNEQIQRASMTYDSTDAEVPRGHDDVLDAAQFAWIARDQERPRESIPIDATETAGNKVMWKLQNDPEAVFRRLWESLDLMKNPKKGQNNLAQQAVRHINGEDGNRP